MQTIERVQRARVHNSAAPGACLRLGADMLDELYGHRRPLPHNLAFGTEGSWTLVRRLREVYPELYWVPGVRVQPMDVVVLGSPTGDPAHLAVVGYRPNTCWISEEHRICEVLMTFLTTKLAYEVKAIYRARDRHRWARSS